MCIVADMNVHNADVLLCYARIRGMPRLVEDEGDEERRGRAIVLQNPIVDAHKDGVEDNTSLQEDGSHHLVCLPPPPDIPDDASKHN